MSHVFPTTRHSVIQAVGDRNPAVRQRAFGVLVEAYWRPIYKVLRLTQRLTPDEAADLTQQFFLVALEKGTFEGFEPTRARFRTYLRACLEHFAANERKAASRKKRGGEQTFVPLDFESAEGEMRRFDPPDPFDIEEYFHREFLRSLMGLAVEELRRRYREAGQTLRLAIFERYDVAPDQDGAAARPTYADLARLHAVPVTQVTNDLFAARRDLRRIVLEKLRETTASEAEYEAEARALLGRRGR